jgi:metal-sulfur cluster biosynthetic enzyme
MNNEDIEKATPKPIEDENVESVEHIEAATDGAAEAVQSELDEQAEPAGGEDVTEAVKESEIREALRRVVDPEIRIDVVSLGLIRDIVFHPDETEVKMILTTPFCPYAGALVQQVKDMTMSVVAQPVRVTLTDERWTPDMMEGGDLSEWGLL